MTNFTVSLLYHILFDKLNKLSKMSDACNMRDRNEKGVRISTWKVSRKETTGITWCKLKDNIKMDPMRLWCEMWTGFIWFRIWTIGVHKRTGIATVRF